MRSARVQRDRDRTGQHTSTLSLSLILRLLTDINDEILKQGKTLNMKISKYN